MRVELEFDMGEVERMLAFGDKAADRAVVRTLNRAATTVASKSSQEIATLQQIQPRKLVRRRIRIDRAKSGRWVAVVRCLTTDIPLIKLDRVTDTKTSGVISPRGAFSRAFIAKGRSRTEQVFQRKGSKRRPLECVKVPIRPTAESVIPRKADDGVATAAKRLPHELNYEWGKFRGSR